MTRSKKQKLYAYVDESGQDTKGKFFLVSVVIPDSQREECKDRLKRIERESGKGIKKWMKATRQQREQYINLIINDGGFKNIGYYSVYQDSLDYVNLTVLTIAKAVLDKAQPPYKATVYVDGLAPSQRQRFATELRKLKVKIRKVRGLRDQSDEFIRLADAIAGFVRDSLEDDPKMKSLYKQAIKNKVFQEI
jgi:ribonuclease HII